MKKFFSLLAAVLFVGSMMADPVVLTFRDTTATDGDGKALFTKASLIDSLTNASDFVTCAAVTKVYPARVGCGSKLGSSSATGSFTLQLVTPALYDSVVIYCCSYSTSEGSITINGDTTVIDLTDGGNSKRVFRNVVYVPTDTLKTLTIATTAKRAHVKSITFYPTAAAPEPEPTVNYYIKHNFPEGWAWKQLTKEGDTNNIYSLRDVYGATGCNWNTSASDEGATWIGSPTLVGSPAEGDSAIFAFDADAKTITITRIGDGPVTVNYYIKHKFPEGWAWKKMTKEGDTNNIYSLRDVYGATGCNWNTTASDEGANWVASPTLVGEPASGDSAVFALDPDAETITITKIEGTPVPTPVVVKDTVIYVAGNFTDWAADMQPLPFNTKFTADSVLEFKQVRVITTTTMTETDTVVAKDTTWYGQTGEASMTRESNAWTLDGSNNVKLTTDADGEYTFALVDGVFTVTFPEKEPEPTPVVTYNVADLLANAPADSTKINVKGVVTKIQVSKSTTFDLYKSANIWVADTAGVTDAAKTVEFFNCYSLNVDSFTVSSPVAGTSTTTVDTIWDANGNYVTVGDTVTAEGLYLVYSKTNQAELIAKKDKSYYPRLIEIRHYAAPAPVPATDLYVVGTVNNWALKDAAYKMTETVVGSEWTFDFGTTELVGQNFKINDGSWSGSVNLGLGEDKLTEGTITVVNGSNTNISVADKYTSATNVVITLKLDVDGSYTLTATGTFVEGEKTIPDLYLRGAANNWNADDTNKFTKVSDTEWTLTIAYDPATWTQGFKVADANWGDYNFGTNATAGLVLGEEYTLASGGDNFSMPSTAVAGEYKFTLKKADDVWTLLVQSTATAIDGVEATVAPCKMIVNGNVIIIRDGKYYDVNGQIVR